MEGVSVSAVVTVDDTQYAAWDEFGASVPLQSLTGFSPGLTPATVLSWPQDSFTDEGLNSLVSSRLALDDVWSEGFLRVIILLVAESTSIEYLGEARVLRLNREEYTNLPDGPYFIDTETGKVTAVARRFEDPLHALIGGGVTRDTQSPNFRFIDSDRYPVPSRLFYHADTTKPLAGLRFAVKDVIDIRGLKTSNGSLCWRELYDPASASAPFIDQLVNAGAILVGKANCTQFCDGQSPSERFEYVSPFNPRGDGYQKASASSSGSAAAAAGYEWIDFTIGTDTGGSIRHPAGVNGVYGSRPTLGSVASRGMISCGYMDTVGVFARSAKILEHVYKSMSLPSLEFVPETNTTTRFKLLYPIRSKDANPDDYPKWFASPSDVSAHRMADDIFEQVVQKLELHLQCERWTFNMEELWKSSHPQGMDESLVTATGTIYQRMVYRAMATDVVNPFIKDYKERRNGRAPFIERVTKQRIAYGNAVSEHHYNEALDQFEKFREWIEKSLFDCDHGTIPILIFPQSWGIPDYRDEVNPSPKNPAIFKPSDVFWEGFSLYSISYVSGCPDITVPVGQVQYNSRVSEKTEWLPVSMSFLSPPKHDLMLLSLLRELENKGIIPRVQIGSQLYT